MITITGYEINDKQFEAMSFSDTENFCVTDEEIENYDKFTEEEDTLMYEA